MLTRPLKRLLKTKAKIFKQLPHKGAWFKSISNLRFDGDKCFEVREFDYPSTNLTQDGAVLSKSVWKTFKIAVRPKTADLCWFNIRLMRSFHL